MEILLNRSFGFKKSIIEGIIVSIEASWCNSSSEDRALLDGDGQSHDRRLHAATRLITLPRLFEC
jgi:hypothetical protein